MVKKDKIKEKIDTNEQYKYTHKVGAENYTGFLNMWSDSQLKLYKPIIESMGELSEKASNISQEAVPEKYREFYEEWIRTYQNSFGKFYPIPTMDSGKDALESLMTDAEESNSLYKSWISELDRNSKTTQEVMLSEPSAAKYKEFCDLWVKMYEKAFDTFFEDMPMVGPMKDTMEPVKVAAKTYVDAHVKMSRMLTKSTFGAASRA